MQNVTNELVQALAAANGLTIAEDRLDLVREQYESYLRTLAGMRALSLPPETEPSFFPPLPPAIPSKP